MTLVGLFEELKKLFRHKLANTFLLMYVIVTALWLTLSGVWLFPGDTVTQTLHETSVKALYLLSMGFLWYFIMAKLLTNRDHIEAVANEHIKMYKNIVNNSPMGMHHYELKEDGRLVFVEANPAADVMLGIQHAPLYGLTIEEAFPGHRPETGSKLPQLYKDIASGKLPLQVQRVVYKDPIQRIDGVFDIYAFQTSENHCTIKFLDVTHDVEDANALIRAENTAKTIASLLLRAEALAKIGSWNLDLVTDVVTASHGAFNIYGLNINEPMGELTLEQVRGFRLPEYHEPNTKAIDDLVKNNIPYDLYFKVKRSSDDKIVDVHSVAEINRETMVIHGMLQDVTEETQAKNQLRQTITEKEVLLQEVHHRVKNNLQITISLLNLQSERFTDPDTIAAFNDAISRLQVMALSHQSLYQSKDFSNLDMKAFFTEIATAITYMWSSEAPMPIEYNLESFALTIDRAIPSGLVLNELLTNVLKHAFPGDKKQWKPKVSISSRIIGDKMELIVADNGIGIKTKSTAAGLGTSLIDSLVHQLRGTIDYHRNGGTIVTFKIPLTNVE